MQSAKIFQLLGDWQLQFPAASLRLLPDHKLLTGVWDFSFTSPYEAGASWEPGGLGVWSDAFGSSEDRRG